MDIPTRRDIEEIARSNQTLYRALQTGQVIGISWVNILQLAVKCLVEYSDRLLENAIKAEELSTKPLSFIEHPQLKELKALAKTVADGNFNHADVIAEARRLSNADA